MKRNIIYSSLATLLLLASCEDFNDKNFDGLDEAGKPTNVIDKKYTLTDDDYTAISALKITDNDVLSSALKSVKNTKYLTDKTPAHDILPMFLNTKWATATKGSVMTLTYNLGGEQPSYLYQLALASAYSLTTSDYKSVWGVEGYEFLSPGKTPESKLPKLLAKAYSTPSTGAIVEVKYAYSTDEPKLAPPFIDENFSGVTASADVALPDWTNFTEKGTTKTWQGKEFSGNKYVQFSANGSKEAENVAWLIAPAVDLSEAVAPTFSFDLKIGFYNAECLQILISDDFTGDALKATWTDVTANFAIPRQPTNGYAADFSIAGLMDMSAYKRRVNIAFKYSGNAAAKKTTTYQIDNFFVGDDNTVRESVVSNENFDEVENNADVALPDWTNFTEKGTKKTWQGKVYSGNKYVQFSANGSKEDENVAWLVTPAITPVAGEFFTFDLVVGYYNAECLQVLVSTDFSGDALTATWKDETSNFILPKVPTGGYGTWASAGIMDLSAYKTPVHIAFKYTGSGNNAKSTTYQIDNVGTVSYSRPAAAAAFAGTRSVAAEDRSMMFKFDGTNWVAMANVAIVWPADYAAMGVTIFSSTIKPADYLPTYLKVNRPYAQEGAVNAVVYNYKTETAAEVRADEYIYKAGVWKNNNIPVDSVTEQFVYTDKWIYDPNRTINLVIGRGQGDGHFQALTDWVWENIDVKNGVTKKGDGYVTSYGNNDYYYGGSEYQNNFDFRPSAWKQQYAGYASMSDDDLTKEMHKRIPDAILHMLESADKDAAPIDGLTVVYTVNFGIYDGKTTPMYTIQFEVTGVGAFTYIEGSFKVIE